MTDGNKTIEATEQMFANVGAAITRWTFVEDALSSIFSICTSTTVCVDHGIGFLDSQTSRTAFYSAENFRTKLALVNAVLSVRFLEMGAPSSDLKSQWMKLQDAPESSP